MGKVTSIALGAASLVQFVAIFALYHFRNDVPGIVLTLVISNSLSQMCVDFLEGTRKKIWSAVFRLVPIMTSIITYFIAVKII